MAHTDPFGLEGEPGDELQLPHPGKRPAEDIVNLTIPRAINTSVAGISQIGMIENILRLHFKLQVQALVQRKQLAQCKVSSKQPRSPETVIRNIPEMFDLGTLVGTTDCSIGSQRCNRDEISSRMSCSIQRTSTLCLRVEQVRPSRPVIHIRSRLSIRRSIGKPTRPMEIPVQRQPADHLVGPSRQTRAELLSAPYGKRVVSKQLEVIRTVKVKVSPVGVRVDFKVASVGYTHSTRPHIARIQLKSAREPLFDRRL